MPAIKNGLTVLLGEDDLEVRSYLETALTCQGYAVELAQDGEEVLSCFRSSLTPIAAIIMDVIMPRKDGIDVLKEIRRSDRDIPIIMMSGASSPLNAVESMKSGANDFIVKPVSPNDLRQALKMALASRPPSTPADRTATSPDRQVFFGTSPRMRGLQKLLGQIGWSDAPVLIRGETGVGKEVIAREVHARSPRAKKPILKLNCAALPSELVESELFGYERGAFTGAFQKKLGMFELADEGTILLDEIGDMDYKLQAKLLQVLQDQEFQRLGGKDITRVDVRVIAATHRDLEKAIAENTFREDLYYRLNVISVSVPPLRERKEDIVPIAEFLIRKHTAPAAAPVQLPSGLTEAFLDYHWPGNVRELDNKIRNYVIFGDAESIERELRDHLRPKSIPVNGSAHAGVPQAVVPAPVKTAAVPLAAEFPSYGSGPVPVLEQVATAKREAERAAILTALKTTNWNRKRAAVLLHIDYKALLYKMKGLSIKKEKPLPAHDRSEAAVSAFA